MKKRKLRNLEVSAIGYGCMGLSHGYGKLPERKEAVKLIQYAFDLGCTFFDTAEGYGLGANEECIQYALDRPAVVSCLVGAETLSELEATLNYYNSTAEERDYSFIGNLQRKDMTGVCVYCNHCLPCPAGIDIGTVNKYIDLIKTGDKIAADHYRKLSKHAGDCIGCGNCERSCPFGVNVRERMEEAKKLI